MTFTTFYLASNENYEDLALFSLMIILKERWIDFQFTTLPGDDPWFHSTNICLWSFSKFFSRCVRLLIICTNESIKVWLAQQLVTLAGEYLLIVELSSKWTSTGSVSCNFLKAVSSSTAFFFFGFATVRSIFVTVLSSSKWTELTLYQDGFFQFYWSLFHRVISTFFHCMVSDQ